jgi:hypothetical protein
MTQPTQDIRDIFNFFPRGDEGAAHHHDRQSESACGFDLGVSRIAAGISSDDDIDAMLHQHCAVAGEIERSPRHDHFRVPQRQRRARRIDQPNQIMMLRMRGEHIQILPPDAEKRPAWRCTKFSSCRDDSVGFDPAITGCTLPRRAFKRQQRHIGQSTGRDRVRAHLRREWMGGIDDARDVLGAEIIDQTFDAAKATDTPGDRRRRRIFGTAGIGQHRIDTRIPSDLRHQPIGIGGAAEDQDPQWLDRGGRHGRQR